LYRRCDPSSAPRWLSPPPTPHPPRFHATTLPRYHATTLPRYHLTTPYMATPIQVVNLSSTFIRLNNTWDGEKMVRTSVWTVQISDVPVNMTEVYAIDGADRCFRYTSRASSSL
jgi:hypothetical protein